MLNPLHMRSVEKRFTATEPAFTDALVSMTSEVADAIEEALEIFVPPADITGTHSTTTLTLPTTCARTFTSFELAGAQHTEFTSTAVTQKAQTEGFLTGAFLYALPAGLTSWNFVSVTMGAGFNCTTPELLTNTLGFPAVFSKQSRALTETAHTYYKNVEYVDTNVEPQLEVADSYINTFTSNYTTAEGEEYLYDYEISTGYKAVQSANITLDAASISPSGTYITILNDGTRAVTIPGMFAFAFTLFFQQVYVTRATVTIHLKNAVTKAVVGTTVYHCRDHDGGESYLCREITPNTFFHHLNANTQGVTWTVQCDWEGTNMGKTYQQAYGTPQMLLKFRLQQLMPRSRPLGQNTIIGNSIPDPLPILEDEYVDPTSTSEPLPNEVDWVYPTVFPTLVSYLQGVTDKDTTLVLSNGYAFKCSSYNTYAPGVVSLFDEATSVWNTASTASSTYSEGGVTQPAYLVNSYSNTTPSTYTGGLHTMTLTNDLEIAGEYFEITLPFQSVLKSIHVQPVTGFLNQAPGDVFVIGSNDDGVTWEPIGEEVFTSYTANVYSTVSFLSQKRFTTFRCVVLSAFGVTTVLRIQNVYYTLDAWGAPPTPELPSAAFPDNTVLASNITFPTYFTNFAAQLVSTPAPNDTDLVITYTQAQSGHEYANGEYILKSASYAEYPVGTNCTVKNCFDDDFNTYYGSTYVGFVTNRAGVPNTPAPTANPYTSGSGTYIYTGGGVANYTFTTSGQAGEWVQVKFPYKFCIKSLSFSRRPGNTRTPRKITILGSDDETNWTTIQANMVYPSTTADNTWYTVNITSPTKRFSILRFIVRESNFAQVTLSLQFTGDTYTLASTTV